MFPANAINAALRFQNKTERCVTGAELLLCSLHTKSISVCVCVCKCAACLCLCDWRGIAWPWSGVDFAQCSETREALAGLVLSTRGIFSKPESQQLPGSRNMRGDRCFDVRLRGRERGREVRKGGRPVGGRLGCGEGKRKGSSVLM